jgi:hypothetical protein
MADKRIDRFFIEEGDRVERLVREGNYGYEVAPEHLAELRTYKMAPTYMVREIGGIIVPAATEEILRIWESDPDNGPADWEFIRLMRRTDHKHGSFFILIFPEEGTLGYRRGYFWRLCLPQPARLTWHT